MKTTVLRWAVVLGLALGACGAGAQQDTEAARMEQLRKLSWQLGPAQAAAGTRATLNIPEGGQLLPESEGARFLELTGNLPEPGNAVLMYGDWWATFKFHDAGYIKDDEQLDADALLKAIKDADEPSNAQRRKLGLDQLYTDGWAVPPHYDPATKHLEWGLKLHSERSAEPVVNYTVRLLGRSGYESVVLVSSADELDKNVKELRTVLAGFGFNGGERYSEFKPGDRVAEIGLGALVLGGAAAAAAKTGFWKTLVAALVAGWKLVAGAVVALFAGLGKLFKRKQPQ